MCQWIHLYHFCEPIYIWALASNQGLKCVCASLVWVTHCLDALCHHLLDKPASRWACLSLDHVPLNSYSHFKHLTDSILGVVHSSPVLPRSHTLIVVFYPPLFCYCYSYAAPRFSPPRSITSRLPRGRRAACEAKLSCHMSSTVSDSDMLSRSLYSPFPPGRFIRREGLDLQEKGRPIRALMYCNITQFGIRRREDMVVFPGFNQEQYQDMSKRSDWETDEKESSIVRNEREE